MTARFVVAALICALAAPSTPAFAQSTKSAAPKKGQATSAATPAAPAPEFKEVALTDKMLEGAIAAQKDVDAIVAKLPQKPAAQPDPKVAAQFEDAAKKNGFANYAEYDEATTTIGVVMSGFDPKTKSYIGPEAVLKQQIAELQADKKIPAKDRKAALDEMNAMLKSPPPAIANKSNIDLVGKYYDKLAASLQGSP